MRTKNNRSLLPSVRSSFPRLSELAARRLPRSPRLPRSVAGRRRRPTPHAQPPRPRSLLLLSVEKKAAAKERSQKRQRLLTLGRSAPRSTPAGRGRGRSVGRSLEYKVTPARACDRPHQQGMIKSRPEWLSQISGQKRESDQGRRARAVRGRGWRIGLLSLSFSLRMG